MDTNARATSTPRALLTKRNRSGKLRLKENRQVPLTDGHKVDYDRAWQLLLDNVRVGPGDVSTEGEFE